MMTVKQQSFSKTLASLLVNVISLPSEYDVEINNIELDSRQLQAGDVFIAVSGEEVNGLDYIDTAIEAGAVAVIWDAPARTTAIPCVWSQPKNKSQRIPLIAVSDLKSKLGEIASLFYGNPSALLNSVAVTGTNGKTSCINFIAQALGKKQKCGLIGTLGIGIYPEIIAGTHTTPDVVTVHKTLAKFVEQGAKFAAVEVSSHALAQGRVDNILFDVAIFTNLTQDHLDYHGTMDAYLEEKMKLFRIPGLETAIINVNNSYGLKIKESTTAKNVVTYGLEQSINNPDVFATDISHTENKVKFILNTSEGTAVINSSLVSDFNISNLLAVCVYLQLQGLSLQKIPERILNVEAVAGRMQRVTVQNKPVVIVDYAHTPDALSKVLQTLHKQFKDNLTCVFGCGGERDKDKRSKMGAVAEQYVDQMILTNDNPRNESENNIIEQIVQGVTTKGKVLVELDRKKAIEIAIKSTSATGCVLIAGKGHENYQLIGNDKIEFNDMSIVKEILSRK